MRADDAISGHANRQLPSVPVVQQLTPAQSAFAEVLGQILAARWRAIHQISTAAPIRTAENDTQTKPREV